MLSQWFAARVRTRCSPRGRLTLERLESRALLASVPVFTPTTGLLMINGVAFTDTDGNRVTAATWQDHEVQMVDSGLAVLHRATGNTRLLKYHNGSNIYFHRHGTVMTPQGSPAGEYAWSGGNVIGTMNSFFTGGDAHAQRIVIHEVAHFWHGSDGETNPVWNVFEGLHNQSQKRPSDPSEYGNPDFAKKYGETNVFEDWATVWELYFKYIPGPATRSATLQAKLDVVRSFLLYVRLI